MDRICAAVIARDAANTIEACLLSLSWADDLLVVVDDRTTDDTGKLAAACGARVTLRKFKDYASQRNAALAIAEGDWVLFVDADEEVPPALASEIRSLVDVVDTRMAGYWVPRDNILFGRSFRYAGWYPDYQLRLLRRGRATYRTDRSVHELVLLDGESGHLSSTIVHHNYDRLSQFVSRQKVYAGMEAADMFKRGVR